MQEEEYDDKGTRVHVCLIDHEAMCDHMDVRRKCMFTFRRSLYAGECFLMVQSMVSSCTVEQDEPFEEGKGLVR